MIRPYRHNRFLALTVAGILSAMAMPVQASDGIYLARFTVERNVVYENEPFSLTLSIFASTPVDRDIGFLKEPGDGQIILQTFKETPAPKNSTMRGLPEVMRFTTAARATRSGRIRIDPGIVGRITETVPAANFRRRRVTRRIQFEQTPLILNVRPIPVPRPDNYSGAIGRIHMTSSLSSKELSVKDLLTIETTVGGIGYLEDMRPPEVLAGPAFKTYPPEALETATDDTRTFRQVLIPLSANATRIDGVALNYFNTGTQKFETLKTGPWKLTFKQRATAPPENANPSAADNRNAVLLTRMAPLQTRPTQWISSPTDSDVDPLLIFERMANAYQNERYTDALAELDNLRSAGFESTDMLFNEGNIQLRLSKPGEAILAYLRARNAGGASDALHANLAIARDMASVGEITQPVSGGMSQNQWSLVAIIALLSAILLPALSRRSSTALLAAGCLILSVISISIAWNNDGVINERLAVILSPTNGQFAPDNSAADPTIQLREGQTVRVLEKWQDWTRVDTGETVCWVRNAGLGHVEVASQPEP